jgi:hypothetical protein
MYDSVRQVTKNSSSQRVKMCAVYMCKNINFFDSQKRKIIEFCSSTHFFCAIVHCTHMYELEIVAMIEAEGD